MAFFKNVKAFHKKNLPWDTRQSLGGRKWVENLFLPWTVWFMVNDPR